MSDFARRITLDEVEQALLTVDGSVHDITFGEKKRYRNFICICNNSPAWIAEGCYVAIDGEVKVRNLALFGGNIEVTTDANEIGYRMMVDCRVVDGKFIGSLPTVCCPDSDGEPQTKVIEFVIAEVCSCQ